MSQNATVIYEYNITFLQKLDKEIKVQFYTLIHFK